MAVSLIGAWPSTFIPLFFSHIHFTLFIGCKGNNNSNNNNNNLHDLRPLDACGMGIAGSAANLMACAILNDCMVCPAQENETVALSNNTSNITETRASVKKWMNWIILQRWLDLMNRFSSA